MASKSDAWITSDEVVAYDSAQATYDCWGSQAHVIMTRKVGILSDEDGKTALRALVEIEKEIEANGFPYDRSLGTQLSLEKLIVEKVGEAVGLQVHTGRSRNDQVMVTQKLFVRDRILELVELTVQLCRLLIARAEEGIDVVMPGYTHMQPARPTTTGQWFAMYADMYLRDLKRLRNAYEMHNTCPLGAADSYGTSWPLDRAYTAELLAFDGLDEIPPDAISSRGESDTDFLSAMSFLAMHMSRAAQDMLLFTTFEYGYAQLGEAVAERMGKLTGSSIMPQKKNPDVLELLRAHASQIYSFLFHSMELAKGMPMGYNRDSRDTKGPILRGLQSIQLSVSQMLNAVGSIEFDEARMLASIEANYCMATDLAEFLAQRCHIPFRIVHRIVGRTVKEAVASGTRLPDVPLEAFQAQASSEGYELDVTSDELRAALEPRAAVERRTIVGGPARPRMQEWLTSRSQQVDQVATWASGQTERIATARKRVNDFLS